MKHLVLLGDSILDNAAYTAGGPSVIEHVRQLLPEGWRCTLSAEDGATTEEVHRQVHEMAAGATHLVLSVGGNNALLRAGILETSVDSSAEALMLLHELARDFELAYRKAVAACLKRDVPLVLCTIYHGNFADLDYQQRVVVALAIFNDVIIRVAVEHRLKVIDLRFVCTSADDYANPIEPSATGGAKVGRAIVQAVIEPPVSTRGAIVIGAVPLH
jgi:hypothetical protein